MDGGCNKQIRPDEPRGFTRDECEALLAGGHDDCMKPADVKRLARTCLFWMGESDRLIKQASDASKGRCDSPRNFIADNSHKGDGAEAVAP